MPKPHATIEERAAPNLLRARMPDTTIEKKIRRVAKLERRPFANMVYYILATYIDEWEDTHGKIDISVYNGDVDLMVANGEEGGEIDG